MMQKTIREKVSFSGIGLHSGEAIEMDIYPAAADSGITFARKDIPGAQAILACVDNVVDTRYATTLGTNGVTVATVEHIMASFYCLGIDNARVELSGSEVPIMDGSAAEFVKLLDSAGIRTLGKSKKYIVVKKAIRIVNGKSSIKILPSDGMQLDVDYRMDFTHPYLSKQSFSKPFTKEFFLREVASARTFGFLSEVEMMREMGLVKGGCLSNAVVIGEHDVLNVEGLRFPDEPVRHKVLDLMGDLALLGAPLIGRVVAYRSGHEMNFKLANKLLKKPSRWEYVDLPKETTVAPGELVFADSLMTA